MATAFKSYLLKINGREVPVKYIASYKSTPNQRQDQDSYQDVTGQLHREVLPHTRTKIELTTKYLWLEDKIVFQSLFPNRVKASVTYWNDKINNYSSGEFYIPDITYEVYRVEDMDMEYKPIRVALIEY